MFPTLRPVGEEVAVSEVAQEAGAAGARHPFDPRGARVLVTGASSGIGAALAEGFAARGAVVGLVARRADRLDGVLERCRTHVDGCRMWVADLADPAQVDDVAIAAVAGLGGVDVLVNN